jgi:hypothetical protein
MIDVISDMPHSPHCRDLDKPMPNLIIVAVHHWPWSIGGLGAIAGATTALVKKYRNEISKQTESTASQGDSGTAAPEYTTECTVNQKSTT